MSAFAEQVHAIYKDAPFAAKELFEALKNGITDKFEGNVELMGATEHGQAISLGHIIRKHMEGKTFIMHNSEKLQIQLKLVKCRDRNPTKYRFIVSDIDDGREVNDDNQPHS